MKKIKIKLQSIAMLAKMLNKLLKIMSTDSVAVTKDIRTGYKFQN